MKNDEVQLKILELLYKQSRKCASYVKKDSLIKNLDEKIDYINLGVHVNYLVEKEYIIKRHIYDGFVTIDELKITEKGIKIVKNSNTSNW